MQLVPGGGGGGGMMQHNPFGNGVGMFGGSGMGMMSGYGMRGIGAGASAPIRARGAEIVSALQSLVEDCDKLSGESQGGATAHKDAIAKLEDKVSLLQVLPLSSVD